MFERIDPAFTCSLAHGQLCGRCACQCRLRCKRIEVSMYEKEAASISGTLTINPSLSMHFAASWAGFLEGYIQKQPFLQMDPLHDSCKGDFLGCLGWPKCILRNPLRDRVAVKVSGIDSSEPRGFTLGKIQWPVHPFPWQLSALFFLAADRGEGLATGSPHGLGATWGVDFRQIPPPRTGPYGFEGSPSYSASRTFGWSKG